MQARSIFGGAGLAAVMAAIGFGVSPAVAQPGEVLVEADRELNPTSGRDPTAASQVIDQKALRAPGTDAADVLSRVPGVQVSKSGASSDLSTASIRGATSAQTPIYLAGVRLNDDVTGTADLSIVPLWMLHRVEVFRGNAPDEADRLGIGGAVFFEPRLPRRSELGAGFEVGSFGALSTWGAGSAAGQTEDGGGAAALVAIRRSQADNDYTFVDDRGTRFDIGDDTTARRENADFEAYDVWAIGRYRTSGGARVTTIFNGFDRGQGLSGLGVVPARASRARVRRLLGAVSAKLPCSRSSRGRCQLEASSLFVTASNVIDDPLLELSLQTTQVASRGERFAQRVGIAHRFGDTLRLRVGATQASERLALDRLGADGIRAVRSTTRPTAAAVWSPTRRFDLNALGAVECHSTRGPTGSDSCGVLEPSGRLGFRYRPHDALDLLANVGRYARAPTLGELFGVSAIVRGNENLEAERGINADAGFRLRTTGSPRSAFRAYVDAFGFFRLADDLVTFRQSSFGVLRPVNAGEARVFGAELMGVKRFFNAVQSELSVTLLDPRDTTPGRSLASDLIPFLSRFVVSERVELFAEPALPALSVDRASVAARVTHRSSRVADPAGLEIIPAQTSLDLEVGVSLAGDRVAARARLENVLAAAQFDAVGFPLPGRAFHTSVELWWR